MGVQTRVLEGHADGVLFVAFSQLTNYANLLGEVAGVPSLIIGRPEL